MDEQVVQVETVDNVLLAESVSDGVKFTMLKDVLVKPLDPVMITKEVQVPKVKEVSTDTEDAKGVGEVLEYDEVETQTVEVKSTFRKGIILKMPTVVSEGVKFGFTIGDTIVYNERFAVNFDLFKDSQLVKPYDIVAIEN
jgi:hypothetical protein